MRRRFDTRERIALYLAANGRCAECGAELEQGWHADHVTPYAKGGETDVVNGQALCPGCNLRKGELMPKEVFSSWPESITPRRCQREAADQFRKKCITNRESSNFLAVVTPAGGKTILALLIAHKAFEAGDINRIVIVVPSDHLKQQWTDEAVKIGIHLDPARKNRDGLETSDFHGVAVTYQQVARASGLHRMGCADSKTLVVFDEVHHAGEDRDWGKEMQYAFDRAAFRLLLSGTAWRSETSPIPYVNYEDGVSKADYPYRYADALADGVNAPISFRSFNGEITWHTKTGDYLTKNLVDEVPADEAARRLRTALDPAGQWLRGVIKQGDEKLREIRASGDTDAAGLIVCPRQEDAKRIAKLVTAITGEEPVVAISEDPEASEKIKAFRDTNARRWIVAVKMVSEGVDIPRLRVGIYATNIITRLFFTQLCGRFTRVREGLEEQTAYLFIPSDETLEGYATEIREEQVHELREALIEKIERELEDIDRKQLEFDLFLPGTSSDPVLNKVIYEDTTANPEELEVARTLREENPLLKSVTDEQIITIVRAMSGPGRIGNGDSSVATVAPAVAPAIRIDRECTAIRKEVGKLASRASHVLDVDHKAIHNMLISHTGKVSKDRSIDEHKTCLNYLKEMLVEYG